MKLVRLRVRHFQCIESAELEFGPGLNVLYGPNDLGKSSLAAAVRAALLIPPGTSASDPFTPWHLDVAPEVELVLCAADERHYRVRKRFGSGSRGSSLLDVSNDGVQFIEDCKGRQVDGRLRELLGWGLSEPGGRGGPRGVPESFLTQVLLAAQSDVPDVLGKGLKDDPTDAGRQRLNQALSALAEHPLFKQVLGHADARVSEAYSATGKRRSGKASPFAPHKLILDELETARRTLAEETASSDAIRRSLHEAVAVRDAALERYEAGRQALASCEKQAAESAARRAALERRDQARAALGLMQEQRERLLAAQRSLGELEHGCATALAQVEQRRADAKLREAACDEAKRRLDEVQSAAGEQRRALEAKRLEAEIAALNAEHVAAEQRQKDAERVLASQATAARARAEVDERRKELEAAARRSREADAALLKATERCQRLEALERCERVRAARRRVQQLRDTLDDAAALEATARERSEEAAREEHALQVLRLPSDVVLEKLRQLRQRLDVAEAKLGGGVSVVLRLAKALQVQARLDGQAVHDTAANGELRFDAQKTLHLQLGDVAELEVTAGEAAARAEAEALQRRWRLEGAPVLTAAKAANLDELLAHCKRASEHVRIRDEARRAAESFAQRANDLRATAGDLGPVQAELERCTTEAADLDLPSLEAELETLGPNPVAVLDARTREAGTHREQAQQRVTAGSARMASADAALQAAVAAAEAASATARESAAALASERTPQQVLDEARSASARAQPEIAARRASIEALASEGSRKIAAAQHAHQAAAAALEHASAAAEEARVRAAKAGEERAAQQARVEEAQRTVDALDFAGAQALLQQREAELGKLPVPAHEPSELDVSQARHAVERQRAEVEQAKFDVTKLEGRLEESGGDTLAERLRDTELAIENARKRQDDVDLDYKAWRLLSETLRESENSEGTHLGRRLAQPVTARFRQLTGGRYGALELDAHLAATGLHVRGGTRDILALSVGTQDQLATLFRLCIAEELESALVLDDHLAQSDPDRIAWFRETLRSAAQKVQVLLFTCRPADYVGDAEWPGAELPAITRAAGLLRVVDLNRVIVRDRPSREPGTAS